MNATTNEATAQATGYVPGRCFDGKPAASEATFRRYRDIVDACGQCSVCREFIASGVAVPYTRQGHAQPDGDVFLCEQCVEAMVRKLGGEVEW